MFFTKKPKLNKHWSVINLNIEGCTNVILTYDPLYVGPISFKPLGIDRKDVNFTAYDTVFRGHNAVHLESDSYISLIAFKGNKNPFILVQ